MNRIKFSKPLLFNSLRGMLAVIVLTIPMLLIGRSVLGEAVIGFLYLVPIVWSATKWDRAGGMSAALTAALCFDFFFIPPFFTFAIASLEGWFMLFIFFAVAIVVVRRIQDSLSTAREATFLYELTSSLANTRTPDAVVHVLARYTRQLFQASQVYVTFGLPNESERYSATEPARASAATLSDRVLPILNAWGLVGEIQIWRGEYSNLPAEESHLLQNISLQAARAFERTQMPAIENHPDNLPQALG